MPFIKMANGALLAYYELGYFFDRQNMTTCIKKIRLKSFLNYNEVFFFISFFPIALKESSLTRDGTKMV